jgi:predicted ATPase/class 3 adenylate cyclase
MPTLPPRTTTILFTDIEGSTDLIQTLGDAGFAEVLEEHNRLLRAAFASHNATEINVKGDAFLVVFDRPSEAVAAAVDAQRAITAGVWPPGAAPRVRIGLHTGEPISVAADYVGLDMHRAARICAAAHGGQILLSRSTALLARDKLPEDARLRDLGEYRLKDLRRAEHIHQLVHPALPETFPPLRASGAAPHNLPRQLTSFVGRERQLDEVTRLLSATPLLTLTGSGGCGKTRLSLEVAAEVLNDYEHGVWLVELAALSEPALVLQAVASALGVRETPGRPLVSTLEDYLRYKHVLLVLDNCEHLVAACAELVEHLLRTCPSLRVLATSRDPLRIPGEVVWRVPSLSFPDQPRLPGIDVLMEYDAVRLLVERATAAEPTFALTPQNVPAVAATCRRLDGIPLAIELAAARVQVLSMEQIVDRLNDRFRLLTDVHRTAVPRHRTLEAAMEWGHDLLAGQERTLFRRLSVFAGGWTVEAVEAVCAGGDVEDLDVLDLLAQLVLKSFVLKDEHEGQARYRFLETMRQYALGKLAASGEAGVFRTRHLDWYRRLGETAGAELVGAGQTGWLNKLETEHDNLRAALEWSLDGGEAEAGLRLAGAVWRFWFVRGYFAEGRRWLDALLEKSAAAPPMARATALRAAGRLGGYGQNDYYYGRRVYEESLAIWRELGDAQGIATLLGDLGILTFGRGDLDAARNLHEESLAIWRRLGNRWGAATSLNNLGRVVYRQGDLEGARSLFQESLATMREVGDQQDIAVALANLGFVALSAGDFPTARSFFEDGLAVQHEVRDKLRIAYFLLGYACLAAAQGQGERAARLFGAEEAVREELGAPFRRVDRPDYERFVAAARSAAAEGAFGAAWAEGRAMTVDQAITAAHAKD